MLPSPLNPPPTVNAPIPTPTPTPTFASTPGSCAPPAFHREGAVAAGLEPREVQGGDRGGPVDLDVGLGVEQALERALDHGAEGVGDVVMMTVRALDKVPSI